MTSFNKPENELARLGKMLGDIEQRIRQLETSRAFRLPVVSQDPPETEPINLWMMPDGRIRGRHLNAGGTAYVYREWVSTAPGSGTSGTAPAPPTSAPQSQEGQWSAIWSHSYRQSGAQRTDGGATFLYYGSSGDGFNGKNQSLIGFDYAAIAAALAGSTVTSVSLVLHNIHAWWNDGADIHFGIHNFTSKPATWAGGGIPRSMIVKHHFGKPQKREVSMPLDFATAIRDGWGKGIALESPSTSREFYGYAAGVGSGYQLPTLKVKYAK